MTSSNEYGLTPALIVAELPGVPALSDANPAEAVLLALISEVSGRANVALRGAGVDPASVTLADTPDLWNSVRGLVKDAVLAGWDGKNRAAYGLALDRLDGFADRLPRRPDFEIGDEVGHGLRPAVVRRPIGGAREAWALKKRKLFT